MKLKHAAWALLLVASPGAYAAAQADAAAQYPNRPIRMIIPFPPGGGTDLTGRAIGQKLTEKWGQTVVVDNRSGANGVIGADLAAKSAPDGYTLLMITSSHAVNEAMLAKHPYDLVRDFTPLIYATVQPFSLIVNPSLPVRNVKDLIALAKTKPGAFNYGSSGTGGLSHLSGALFGALAGIELTHVPYKGGYPAMLDVIGGQLQLMFATLLQSQPQIKAGKLRVLAVTTAQRWPAAPELPSMSEAGVPGYEIAQWYGLLAPEKTPKEIVRKLNREIDAILKLPEMADKLAADGAAAVGGAPERFGAHVRTEVDKYRKLVKQIGLKAEQ
ncbi:MAG: tripartite tricarboxylate transporter substrate binding protein [Rhodospirillaceae bacterium]